jgi:hypothetical protein
MTNNTTNVSQEIEINTELKSRKTPNKNENIENEVKNAKEIDDILTEEDLIRLSIIEYQQKVFIIMALITILMFFLTIWFGCEWTHCVDCKESKDNNTYNASNIS